MAAVRGQEARVFTVVVTGVVMTNEQLLTLWTLLPQVRSTLEYYSNNATSDPDDLHKVDGWLKYGRRGSLT